MQRASTMGAGCRESAGVRTTAEEIDALVYQRILESVTSGVMLIDASGIVRTFNEAATETLGLRREDVVGRGFGEVFVTTEGLDEFSESIFAAVYEDSVGHQNVATVRIGDGETPVSIATSYLHDPNARHGRGLGVVAVFNDISELQSLRSKEISLAKALETKHTELRSAYLELEERNRELGAAMRRGRLMRAIAFVVGVGIAGATGLYLWGKSPATWLEGDVRTEGINTGPAQVEVVSARVQTMRSTLRVPSRIAPLRETVVTSPVNAEVAAVHVQHGQRVQAGDVLIEMDISETRIAERRAQVAYIKAERRMLELIDWESSPEATRAKRAVSKAQIAAETAEESERESRFLLEKGLVSRDKHASAERQAAARRVDLEAAEQDLMAARAKGRASREVAKLELANARAEVAKSAEIMMNSTVRTPVSGVVLRQSRRNSQELAPGANVKQGDVLLKIGEIEGVAASGEVDEASVTRLALGQPVIIRGSAFPGIRLKGTISEVSSQASGGTNLRSLPTFTVGGRVERLTAEQRERLRLGMSATMEIITYENRNAVTVPVEAVNLDESQPRVRVRDREAQTQKWRTVRTGITNRSSVEILEGLGAGEEVVLP